jgi:hypothetical protein
MEYHLRWLIGWLGLMRTTTTLVQMFAKGGYHVRVFDVAAAQLEKARESVALKLALLSANHLVDPRSVPEIEARISYHSVLAEALDGAFYLQVCHQWQCHQWQCNQSGSGSGSGTRRISSNRYGTAWRWFLPTTGG